MRERSRFENELGYLGVREAADFESNQDFVDWQKSGKKLHVDLYDRSNAHLQYLGRISLRSSAHQWEKRVISRSDLDAIYAANRVQTADPADFAFSPPHAAPENRLFPDKVGRQGLFNRTKIEQQTRTQGRTIQIWNDAKQRKALSRLFEKARTTGKEQGVYIVLKIYDRERRAALWFLTANPASSSAVHFTADYGAVGPVGSKIISVPNDRDKQVIGLVHTHYLAQPPVVTQTTHVGTTWSERQIVKKLVHAVSADDIRSAVDNEFIVYALERNQIHKAVPNGKAINGMKWPSFNVLEDALDSFSGKSTY